MGRGVWRVGVSLVALAAAVAAPVAAWGEGLPDGRVYEQVSPVKKSGNSAGTVSGSVKYALAAADGDGVLYAVSGPMGSAPRGIEQYAVGRRGAVGWSSASAIPAGWRDRIDAGSYGVFGVFPSSDLTKALFTSSGSFAVDNPDTLGSSGALYLGHADGTVEWLSRPRIANPIPAPGNIEHPYAFQPVGGAPDLSRVYFYGQPSLLAQDAGRLASGLNGWGLWEYSGGELEAAGTLPDGSEPSGGAAPASSRGPYGALFNFATPDSTSQQVSRDGSTLWFVSPDPGAGGVTQLYVRRDGRSTLVSHMPDGSVAPSGVASARTLTAQPLASTSQYAYGSADGSTAIFQSVDALAAGAPSDSSQKAYRYDVATDTVSYLPGVAGSVVAASDDDTRFLFTDTSRIGIWDHGTVKTIAPVGASFLQLAPARATASGSVFLFSTQAPIPGFNNGGGFIQVYRYDVAASKLACLSCPPAGAVPTGSASLSNQDVTGFQPSGELVPGRGMSDGGGRVFFDSPDALVSSDTNGRRDVYEWTPDGLSLISSGRSHEASWFLDNSADGNDVFFTTSEGLDAGDRDGNYDVYDARVGGGFRTADQTAPCVGDACQGGVSADPASPVAASGVFSGPGDQPPPKAAVVPSAKLKLGGRRVVGGVLEVSVSMTRPGRVSVSGGGLRAVSKSYVKAGSYTVRVALTASAKRSLKRKHRLKLSVRVGFTPSSGAAASVRFVVNAKA